MQNPNAKDCIALSTFVAFFIPFNRRKKKTEEKVSTRNLFLQLCFVFVTFVCLNVLCFDHLHTIGYKVTKH